MRHATLAFIAVFAGAGLAGCDGDDGSLVSPAPGPTPSAPVRNVDPVPGGGTSGDDLAGLLTVFVLDADAAPVPGAWVQAGSLTVQTDDAGRVDLEQANFFGAIDVHVFALGFAYHSTLGLSVSVLTVALEPELATGATEPRGVATISGQTEGWARLPAPTSGLTRVIEVEAFGPAPLAPLDQPRRPGSATLDDPDGMPMNIALDGPPPFPAWRSYTLRTETTATGLIAFGSTFDPDRSPALIRSHIGLLTGMQLAEGEVMDGVDIALTHELDVRLWAHGPASTLEQRSASFGLDLGVDGIVPLSSGPLSGAANRWAFAPRLEGILSGASYVATIHFASNARIDGRPAREALAGRNSTRTDFDLKDMLEIPVAPALAGRTLAAPGPDGAELRRARVTDERGRLRWEIWSLDSTDRSVVLPEPPAGLADGLPTGRVEVESSAFDLGLEPVRHLSLTAAVPRSEAHHRVIVDR